MKFTEIIPILSNIIESTHNFTSPYQIGSRIQEEAPEIWNRLITEYGIIAGKGTGSNHSWASFISKALHYCNNNTLIPEMRMIKLNIKNMVFDNNIKPGCNVISMWAGPILEH